MAGHVTVDENQANALTGVYQVASIDGKTQGNTTLLQNGSGRSFVLTAIDIVLTSVSGLGTPPVVNLGKTAANYADIVNGFALTNLTGANTFIRPTLLSAPVLIQDGESLVLRVATAAILTTTYTFTAVARGYYL